VYRFVEHTAELGLELAAPTAEGVFEEALAAFRELSGGAGAADGEPAAVEVELAAPDRALLLVDWLNELVFLAETEGLVPEAAADLTLAGGRLRASVRGRRGSPRPLVKAVTLSGLRFEREGDGWRAEVVVDV